MSEALDAAVLDAERPGERRLVVILAQERAWEHAAIADSFADLPACHVIVDRRRCDRRRDRPESRVDPERRGHERRSASLEHDGTVVLRVR